MTLTLSPITRGIRDGRHQHYPTPNVTPRPVTDEATAQKAAVRMLRAYGSVSYLRLVDGSGADIREYRRADFFFTDSPLRDVHHRVVAQDLSDRTTEQ